MEPLTDWLTPLPDAEMMRAVDRWAIEERGVSSLELMERAGAGVARAVEHLAPDGPVTVVCGKGNNGGDGLVVARMLREAAREVTVICTASLDELTGDARDNLQRLPGSPPAVIAEVGSAVVEMLDGPAVIVDAVLGTGFEGAPRGAALQAIEAIGAARAPVVAVDVPSGVQAATGIVKGAAVRAAVTVTFYAAKPGLWIRPGKDYAGEVRSIDIGIPRGAPGRPDIGLIRDSVLAVLPRRTASSTKFLSGHVVVAGGSRGLIGAPAMTALAAMRAGAGYVTACVPASAQQTFVSAAPLEVMSRGLPDVDGEHVPEGADEVRSAIDRGGALALALGPGLGRSRGAIELARELAASAEVAMVLDADGLNAHAGCLEQLASRQAPTVLTPHAGELARLLELDSSEIERERLRYARVAAARARAVVVLKGDDTLIADPAGHVAVSPGGSPGLATAGTGDVLTGVIAALLAQGLDAFTAAAAGVCLHAAAGRMAERRQGAAEGVIATDVIAALPAVRAEEQGA